MIEKGLGLNWWGEGLDGVREEDEEVVVVRGGQQNVTIFFLRLPIATGHSSRRWGGGGGIAPSSDQREESGWGEGAGKEGGFYMMPLGGPQRGPRSTPFFM